MEKGVVIVNPTAGNGEIRKSLPKLLELVGRQKGWIYEIPIQELQLLKVLQIATDDATSKIVVVGGDGTNHKIFTCMFLVGGEKLMSATKFAFTNGGTMNFVARSFNVKDDPTEHLTRVFQDKTQERKLQILRFDGIADYPLYGTFAGFGAAATILGKYRKTAGGRFRVMEWIARGAAAAVAPKLDSEIAALLAPANCGIEVDGVKKLCNPIGMVVSAIEEFKLRFPFTPPVRPFRNKINTSSFGVIASNRSPRELAEKFWKLWNGKWRNDDQQMLNASAKEIIIHNLTGLVNIDGDEYYSRSGKIRISCGPVITVLT